MDTVEYAPGRLADVYGEPEQRTVLLWHGAQTDTRTAVRPLAERIAGHGLGVVAPDWDSHAADGGRADLLRSADFAQNRVHDGLVLVGWSLGGVAAAGLTIHARDHGIRIAHTVCLAGAFMVRDPISGQPPSADVLRGKEPCPFTLLHGTADDVVPVAASREFAYLLERHGWPVEFVELSTDHGAIAGATYDPAADSYSAAEAPETLAVAAEVARRIAATA